MTTYNSSPPIRSLADSLVSEAERRSSQMLGNASQIRYGVGTVVAATGSTVGVAYPYSNFMQTGIRLPAGADVHRGSLVRVTVHPDGSAFITEVY
jgi:hypothetical protein